MLAAQHAVRAGRVQLEAGEPELRLGAERRLDAGDRAGGELEVGVDLRDHVVRARRAARRPRRTPAARAPARGGHGRRRGAGAAGPSRPDGRRRTPRRSAARRRTSRRRRARAGRAGGSARRPTRGSAARCASSSRKQATTAKVMGGGAASTTEQRVDGGPACGGRSAADRARRGRASRQRALGERGVDRVAQPREARLHREARLDVAPTAGGHRPRRGRIGGHPRDRRRERGGVRRRHEQPGLAVGDDLRHAADGAGDHRGQARERLHEDERRALAARGQQQDVGAVERRVDPVGLTAQADAAVQAAGVGLAPQAGGHRRVLDAADEVERGVEAAVAQRGERLDGRALALVGRDRADDAEAERSAERGLAGIGARRRRRRDRDPVGDPEHPRPAACGQVALVHRGDRDDRVGEQRVQAHHERGEPRERRVARVHEHRHAREARGEHGRQRDGRVDEHEGDALAADDAREANGVLHRPHAPLQPRAGRVGPQRQRRRAGDDRPVRGELRAQRPGADGDDEVVRAARGSAPPRAPSSDAPPRSPVCTVSSSRGRVTASASRALVGADVEEVRPARPAVRDRAVVAPRRAARSRRGAPKALVPASMPGLPSARR